MAKFFELDTLAKRVRETLARPSAFAKGPRGEDGRGLSKR